ncbi:hypothetical protein [Bosea sp. ANAM02]|uniref:hypothetical protein n=1 Tax=Bosea sp. ANAM02 TaxID=2020412 RepID=UPI00140EC7D4|nr:hypothetical protein [Bosea sp. ANAM02]BCB22253.1 hypothetical protein OCUBac02_51470 [Bosea sp. ANAM02]
MSILTPQQALTLQGTRAADAAGRPLVLWHGTRHIFESFGHSTDLGYHFGSRRQAERRLQTLSPAELDAAPGPERLIPVALRVANPIFLPDDPRCWTGLYLARALRRFLPADRLAQIRELLPREFYERKAIIELLRQGLKTAGFDGIIYRNSYESSARSVSWSWLVLDSENIVILPPETDASAIEWPDGFLNRPGFDPDAELSRVGGIRTKAGDVKLAADRRAILIAATDALSEFLPEGVHLKGDKDYSRVRFNHAERLVQVEVSGRIGRMHAAIGGYQREELAGLGLIWGTPAFDAWRNTDSFRETLSGSHTDDRVSTDRDHHSIFVSWQPGQQLEAFVKEFTDLLRVSLAAVPPPPAPIPAPATPRL